MISLDTKPTARSLLLLLLLALLLYLPVLSIPEVRQADEALQGAFIQDVVTGENWWQTRLYGQPVAGFPLYSWLGALTSFLRMPTAFTLRLPTVLSLFGLALCSGLFAWRAQGRYAGYLAASVVLTSAISFRTGIRAQSETVAALLLTLAWFLLYAFGWKAKRWWTAWGCSLLAVFLAQFAVGFKAPVVFYLPLLFLRNGFRTTDRLEAPSHVFPSLCFVILTIAWLLSVPGQPYLPWSSISSSFFAKSGGHSYLRHLVTMFPFAVCYLFPWTFFAWGPFCLALRQFEQNGPLCHYLRVIVISNFILFWLLPKGSPLHLLPVFGPMAVLVGIHSEIIIRRYRNFWRLLLRLFGLLGLAGSLFGLLVALALARGVLRSDILQDGRPGAAAFFCLGALPAALILSLWLLLKRNLSYRSAFLLAIAACQMPILSLSVFLGLHSSVRRENGLLLARNCPKNATVCLEWMDNISAGKLLVETFYMQAHILASKDPNAELSKSAETEHYLLSTRTPVLPEYQLSVAGQGIPLGERASWQFSSWNRKRPFLEIQRRKKSPAPDAPTLQLFKANRKPEGTTSP